MVDVINVVANMRLGKCSGPDGLHIMEAFRYGISFMYCILLYLLLNICMKFGYVPSQLRSAVTDPSLELCSPRLPHAHKLLIVVKACPYVTWPRFYHDEQIVVTHTVTSVTGHALRTCGINLGATLATPPVMDEAMMMMMMKLPILACAEKLELVLSTAPRT